jgi:hypothetical protein
MRLSIVICASSDEAHLGQTLTALKFGFRCVSKPAPESHRPGKSRGSPDTQRGDVEPRRKKAGEAGSRKKAEKPTPVREIAGEATRQQSMDALESARRGQKWMNNEHEKEGGNYGMGYGAALHKSTQGQRGNSFEGELVQGQAQTRRSKERVLTSCEKEHVLSAGSSGDDSITHCDEKRNRSSPIIATETAPGYTQEQELQKSSRDRLHAWKVLDDLPIDHDRGHAGASGEQSQTRTQQARSSDMEARAVDPKSRNSSSADDVVHAKRRGTKPERVPSLQSNSEGEDPERIRVYSSGKDGSVSPVRHPHIDILDESSPKSMTSNSRLSAKDLTLIDYAQRLEVYEEVGCMRPHITHTRTLLQMGCHIGSISA